MCGIRWYPKLVVVENSSLSLRERMKAALSYVPSTTASFRSSRTALSACILGGPAGGEGQRLRPD